MGITFKSDGKSESNSSSEPLSEKFTQRAKAEDFYYEEHDKTETREYQKEKELFGPRFFFGFAIMFAFVFLLFGSTNDPESLINLERDKTLAEQRELKEQENFRKNKKSPFDEA